MEPLRYGFDNQTKRMEVYGRFLNAVRTGCNYLEGLGKDKHNPTQFRANLGGKDLHIVLDPCLAVLTHPCFMEVSGEGCTREELRNNFNTLLNRIGLPGVI
jgi:hypothetical protein